MNKFYLIYVLFFFVINSIAEAQEPLRLLSYDLVTKQTDTLPLVQFDTSMTNEKSPFSLGNFNNIIAQMPENVPIENTYHEEYSQFTKRVCAANEFELTNYPLRTSCKLFVKNADTLDNRCSGSMISSRHLLTTAHCFFESTGNTRNDTLVTEDSILVCPIYNNGDFSFDFDCVWAKKIYYFDRWISNGSYSTDWYDFAILELDNPIGNETGWIGMGYQENDSLLLENMFYKFAYPNVYYPELEERPYNGDTLYFEYGKSNYSLNSTNPNLDYLNFFKAVGIPGVSGSSAIAIKNEEEYTSYGVAVWAINYRHRRITDWVYHALYEVIKNDLQILEDGSSDNLIISPNPIEDKFSIVNIPRIDIQEIKIYSLLGIEISNLEEIKWNTKIDVSTFPSGIYVLKVTTDYGSFSTRIMKK